MKRGSLDVERNKEKYECDQGEQGEEVESNLEEVEIDFISKAIQIYTQVIV